MPKCHPKCKGWDVFDSGSRGLEIERCDECARYPDDDHAFRAAMRQLRISPVMARALAREHYPEILERTVDALTRRGLITPYGEYTDLGVAIVAGLHWHPIKRSICRATGLGGWTLVCEYADGRELLDLDVQGRTIAATVEVARESYPGEQLHLCASDFWLHGEEWEGLGLIRDVSEK